jgi:hypothetical protein
VIARIIYKEVDILVEIHKALHPIVNDNQIIHDLEVKDYARRMKTLHPELNILPGTNYFMISRNNEKTLISTCR